MWGCCFVFMLAWAVMRFRWDKGHFFLFLAWDMGVWLGR